MRTEGPAPAVASLRLICWIALGSAAAGALYGLLGHGSPGYGAAIGAVNGFIFASLEIFGFRNRVGQVLHRLPFLLHLALRIATYVALAILLNALALPLIYGRAAIGSLDRADIVFALCACVGANLLFAVNELLGSGALFAFAAGRYYRPRREERALLFIDLRSSTAIAERLGEVRFLDFLNAFFTDVSLALVEHGGEIHKYVGDEVIATWPLRQGRNRPECIRACFAAIDRLAARAPYYAAEFDVGAEFRAALHGGALVVGELGHRKKEIALIGDAMKTAARILEACRETHCPVLASAALLDRLEDLPAGVAARKLAPLPLRGKALPLELDALERAGAGA